MFTQFKIFGFFFIPSKILEIANSANKMTKLCETHFFGRHNFKPASKLLDLIKTR